MDKVLANSKYLPPNQTSYPEFFMDYQKLLLLSFFLLSPLPAGAQENLDELTDQVKHEEIIEDQTNKAKEVMIAKNQAEQDIEQKLDQFGFGPALYLIHYKEEVLQDSKDVSLKGNGAISSSGSKYSTSLGVELHYDFSFARKLKCFYACEEKENWNLTSGHRISPFFGMYDLDGGINGIAAGLVYGYWKGDTKGDNKATLNAGLGWTVHKNRLVLADGIREGAAPSADLNTEDYTERKDVNGLVLMISVNMGF